MGRTLPAGSTGVYAGQVRRGYRTGRVVSLTHDELRQWVAQHAHLGMSRASPEQLAKLEKITAAFEARYVRGLLALPDYRPPVG